MRTFSYSHRFTAATLLALILASYVNAQAKASEIDHISRINGGIRVDAQRQVGNVSTVNGGITLEAGAKAEEVDTVNGGITLEDEVTVETAETVNGGIRVGNNVTVTGSLETVNGAIRTRPGTVVERHISTVNGKIDLHSTKVRDDVRTANGDIELQDGSLVEGDIVVRSRGSWFSRLFGFNRQIPTLRIDSSSEVRGTIHLYREVDLYIDDEARVGRIVEHY